MINTEFTALGLSSVLCRALTELDYTQPTPIQQQAIPELIAGSDLLGIAQTGTGKTAAFTLPILEMLLRDGVRADTKRPKVLILSPTRELAAQIRDEIAGYGRYTELRHACIFGGVGQNPQVKTLAKGVEILVATPGRLLDLVQNGFVHLDEVSHLVLDEADRLLDMGFIRDVKKIIGRLPRQRQSLLFSATMPKEVADLASEILRRPVRIDVSPKVVAVAKIEQRVVHIDNADKPAALQQLLLDPDVSRAIVFTRTKHGANRVAKKLDRAGILAEAIHGNKSQAARTRALDGFKSGKIWVLVATDIAARGIDVDGVSHVINFELPHEPESYVHRIGRTARAGASGVAWSLVDSSEVKRLRAVEKLTKLKIPTLEKTLDLQAFTDQSAVDQVAMSENRPRTSNTANSDRKQVGGQDSQEMGGNRPGRRRRRSRKRRVA